MAIEYLKVTYPRRREVLANDVPVGDTNVPLLLPADVYTITLAGEQDYTPASVDVVLGETTKQKPRVVAFAPR